MDFLTKTVRKASAQARKKRAEIFCNNFEISAETKILDLGSEDGSHIKAVLKGANVVPENVFIADINAEVIERGRRQFGFTPVLLDESGKLPFANDFFDVVYCSSVIEHVTVSKAEVWNLKSGEEFVKAARAHQKSFAEEIRRVGKQYFVQTPNVNFPIESHSWLPLVAFLPRGTLISVLKTINKFWIKKTQPDFYLLNEKEMSELFPDARIVSEKKFGITKSLMAIKTLKK